MHEINKKNLLYSTGNSLGKSMMLGKTEGKKRRGWQKKRWLDGFTDPMDSTVHGILQARILGWVTFPFSRRSSQPRDRTQVSRTAGGFFTIWATKGSIPPAWVQVSRSVMSDSLRPQGLQHTRLPCPSPTLRAYSNSCPLSRRYHPTILSSIIPFCSCLQSFPSSGALATKFVLICYSSHRKWRHHLSRILSTTC